MVGSEPGRAGSFNVRLHLQAGQVIPAHPLALTPARSLDERYQRAITRYYVESGAGGFAVGVHTTQFAIRDSRHGLFRPVLELAAEAADGALAGISQRPFVKIAGAIGETRQAVAEAEIAAACGYHAVLLSLGGLDDLDDGGLILHCRAVADVLPLVGFYLQPAVGGRDLGYTFWRELAELPNLVAIKIAPFDRYRTLDVVRAIAASGRADVALYTGNDDNIVLDLLTPFPVATGGGAGVRHLVGGLLGHWAVWTRAAVQLHESITRARESGTVDSSWLTTAAAVTDMNAALFDPAHRFAGCVPGIHEVLRRQGLMRGSWTLDPRERMSDGQAAELDRVIAAYPELTDDAWVAERVERWLR